jgi:hypothetical protein
LHAAFPPPDFAEPFVQQDVLSIAGQIVETCRRLAIPVKSTAALAPQSWMDALAGGLRIRTMRFPDAAAMTAAFYITMPQRSKEEAIRICGETVLRGLRNAFDLLVVDADACPLTAIPGLPINSETVAAIALHSPVGLASLDALSDLDRRLFDRGFVRVALADSHAADRHTFLYARSDRVGNLTQLDGRRAHGVSLVGLPKLGRYANQTLQVIGMILYGARNNATVSLPEWVGNTVFDIPPPDNTACERVLTTQSFSFDDLVLWDPVAPAPVNVDFEAFFQVFPRVYDRHKAFIRRILRFHDRVAGRVHSWFDQAVPPGGTLVTIHIRRGDYLLFQKDAPWFTVTPVEWYRNALARLWPTLSNPRLVVATDEPLIQQFFQDYRPLDVRPSCPHLVNGEFIADFIALQRADIALICNSSFSRTAVLLSDNDRQAVFKPGWAVGGFVPIDPWADRLFWDWFAPMQMPDPALLTTQAKACEARGETTHAGLLYERAAAVNPADPALRDAVRRLRVH